MKVDFQGKTALITGATRGIGLQIAEDMEQCGARLILTGSNEKTIKELKDSAKGMHGKREYHAVDFREREAVSTWIDALCLEKNVDVCINNAGMNKINAVHDVADREWDELLKVNLEAPLIITRRVGQSMKDRRSGRIVNIASIFGVISKSKRVLYSMTKFALRGLTMASAIDLAPYNVLVNAVSPGFVMTDLTRNILGEEEMKTLASQVPLGRFAAPAEISRTVLFLASELNTYITGQNIVVDGGFTSV